MRTALAMKTIDTAEPVSLSAPAASYVSISGVGKSYGSRHGAPSGN